MVASTHCTSTSAPNPLPWFPVIEATHATAGAQCDAQSIHVCGAAQITKISRRFPSLHCLEGENLGMRLCTGLVPHLLPKKGSGALGMVVHHQ